MQTNYAKFSLLLGNKYTGKTTYLKSCINAYMSGSTDTNPRKVLIIDTYLSPSYSEYAEIKPSQLLIWEKGVKRMVVNPFELEPIIDILVQNEIDNLLLIVEDCGKYLENDKELSQSIKIWQRDVKNKGLETIFVFHFFADVPRKLFKLTDIVIVKKTGDTINDVKSRTSHPMLIEAWKRVNLDTNQYAKQVVAIT